MAKLLTDLSKASKSTLYRRANPEQYAREKAARNMLKFTNPEQYAKNIASSMKSQKARLKTLPGLLDSRFSAMKTRAKEYGRGFKITRAYLDKLVEESGMVCAISGVKLSAKQGDLHVLSFDRINNNAGYVYGNVQVVSAYVNTAKLDLTSEEFVQICEQIVAHNKAKV